MVRLAPLHAAFPEARWTAPEDLHLTLVFIGAVAVELVPAVVSVVVAVATGGAPFRIAVRGTGEFGGRRRPRVTWLGIDEGVSSVAALDSALRAGLAALPGLEGVSSMPLTMPHLTVARDAAEGLVGSLRDAFAVSETSWIANRLVLYRSDLGRRGARHERIVTAPLGGDLPPRADED
jgi:2'-5' RNA ligase